MESSRGEKPSWKAKEGVKKSDHGKKQAHEELTKEMEEEKMEEDVDIVNVDGEGGRDFAIKLEFKLPKEARSFNCAALHRKWFEMVESIDQDAKIITASNTAISNVKQFPKDQSAYNKAFPQRVTQQPGQARVAEVVFEIRKEKRFTKLKTNNT